MSQATSYKALSQFETRNETENGNISLNETSDELTSLDSLDLVLLEIGSTRKVKRKKRQEMGMHNFDGTESYEVRVNKPSQNFNVMALPKTKPVSLLLLSVPREFVESQTNLVNGRKT